MKQNGSRPPKYFYRSKTRGRLSSAIAAAAVSPSTVRETLKRLASPGLSWPLPEGFSDTELEAALYTFRVASAAPDDPDAGLAGRRPSPAETGTVVWHAMTAVPGAMRFKRGGAENGGLEQFLLGGTTGCSRTRRPSFRQHIHNQARILELGRMADRGLSDVVESTAHKQVCARSRGHFLSRANSTAQRGRKTCSKVALKTAVSAISISAPCPQRRPRSL
jgi:hypothetical protein